MTDGERSGSTAADPDVELIPFRDGDFDRLIAWSPTAADLLQWAGPGLRFPLTHTQLPALRGSTHPDVVEVHPYTALRAADGHVVGHGEIAIKAGRRGKLMRIVIDPELRGRGYGRDVTRALMRRAFGDLGLETLELNVYDYNEAAIRCYTSLGFRSVETPDDGSAERPGVCRMVLDAPGGA